MSTEPTKEPVPSDVGADTDKPTEDAKSDDSQTADTVDKADAKKVKKKSKKKKAKFVDDGHTVFSMEGLSKHKTDAESLDLSKKERRALIKAAFAHYLPILLGVIGCFSIAALIIYLWLH